MNLKEKQKKFPFSLKNLSLFLSTGGFIGYLPPFPGTLGALEGVFLYRFFINYSFKWHLVMIFFLLIIGIITSQVASKVLQNEDPDQVVIDEIVGAYLACLGKTSFWELTLAFIFFRIIDITKPFPMRRLERLKGGFGIMADDVLAGIMTNLIVTLLYLGFGV